MLKTFTAFLCFGVVLGLLVVDTQAAQFPNLNPIQSLKSSNTKDCFDAKTPVPIQFAKGFSIEYFQGYKKVTVINQWAGTQSQHTYILTCAGSEIPDNVEGKVIEIPIQRSIILSTTYAQPLEVLGQVSTLVGVSYGNRLQDSQIQAGIAAGKIADYGNASPINPERLLIQDPDVVWTFASGDPKWDNYTKLEKLGVPVVINSDYQELHPLGRAEWVIFFAAFFNLELEAESLFKDVVQQYQKAQRLVDNLELATRPKVMVATPYGQTWHVPTQQTFMANLVYDAGGQMAFQDDQQRLYFWDVETVIRNSTMADVWLASTSVNTLNQLAKADPRIALIQPVRTNRAFAHANEQDIWTTASLNPHLLLADFIAILHPNQARRHELEHYQQVEINE